MGESWVFRVNEIKRNWLYWIERKMEKLHLVQTSSSRQNYIWRPISQAPPPPPHISYIFRRLYWHRIPCEWSYRDVSESLLVLPLSSSHSKLEVPDLKFTSLSWKYQEPGSCTSLDFLSILVRSRYSHSRGWALGTKPCFGLLQLLCCPMGLTKNHDCFSSSEIQFCLLLHDALMFCQLGMRVTSVFKEQEAGVV